MKNLKSTASRFFKDGPSQDEKIAHAELGGNVDFDAGIHSRGLKLKSSRFFSRKVDKTSKPLPAFVASLAAGEEQQLVHNNSLDDPPVSSAAFHFSQPPLDLVPSPVPSSCPGSTHSSPKSKTDAQNLKPRPSFATLRSKSSRILRTKNPRRSSPPPPPLPQIPVELEAPPPRRLNLVPVHVARKSHGSILLPQGGNVAISRPMILPRCSNPPIPETAATVPFTKPVGPPPPRPPRPDSLDNDIVNFMQQSGMRMVIGHNNRASNSTVSSSSPRSISSSVEARLGLPSGHSTPRIDSLDSPLAARFPLDVFHPLPIRNSAGSVTFSRFSDYVRAERGGYASDGVDKEDRELGPIELFDKTRADDWTLEKRVSNGPNGNPGMLFRDRASAFHFVADV